MSGRSGVLIVFLLAVGLPDGARAGKEDRSSPLRISAGMGVSAVNAQDLVVFIRTLTRVEVSDFKSGVEFFGAAAVPLGGDWSLKLEYAYLLGTYNVGGAFGAGEFTFRGHLPTLIAQYTLVEEPTYAVRAGGGIGYHAGSLSARYATFTNEFSAGGPGAKLELEATTAFSREVSAYLGADFRWDFIGDLKSDEGNGPPGLASTSLHFFSAGAKLGFTYSL